MGAVGGTPAVDAAYTDARLAALYDSLNPWGRGDDFSLSYVTDAGSALDLGCGTGVLLSRARAQGHRGVLVGADPAPAMLDLARRRGPDVTWLLADAETVDAGRAFDLVTMTGHAFQVLLTDDAIRAALANARRHLAPGGRFVFETRNPAARAWERWTPERSRTTVTAPDGEAFTVEHALLGTREGGLVDLVTTFRTASGEWTSESTLRFASREELRALLAEAGLRVEAEYGWWDRSPFEPASREIVLVTSAGR